MVYSQRSKKASGLVHEGRVVLDVAREIKSLRSYRDF